MVFHPSALIQFQKHTVPKIKGPEDDLDGDRHMFGYSSIENAIAQGQEPANGRIVIRGPQVKYLYFGKVMAGRKPKHVTNKDIRYTTTFNRLAGPFWLERLMAAEKDRIIEDERRNILGGP